MLKNRKFWIICLKGAFLVAFIAFALYFARFVQENEILQEIVHQYGYGGVFLLAFVSGFNVAVPLPAVAFMPFFLQAELSFWSLIFFIVLGATIADLTAYFVGRVGRQALVHAVDGSIVSRLGRIRERHFWWPIGLLFLFSAFMPFPNEIMLAPLGFLGYHFFRILPALLAGNVLFNTIYAFGFMNAFEFL